MKQKRKMPEETKIKISMALKGKKPKNFDDFYNLIGFQFVLNVILNMIKRKERIKDV